MAEIMVEKLAILTNIPTFFAYYCRTDNKWHTTKNLPVPAAVPSEELVSFHHAHIANTLLTEVQAGYSGFLPADAGKKKDRSREEKVRKRVVSLTRKLNQLGYWATFSYQGPTDGFWHTVTNFPAHLTIAAANKRLTARL